MTPAELAKSGTEHANQRALFAWANLAERYGFAIANDEASYKLGALMAVKPDPVPELRWMHAIPNGGPRDSITAGKLRAEGVKRGIPDLFLPVPIVVSRVPAQVAGQPPFNCLVTRYCGLYVELKRPKSATQRQGSTSEDQNEAIAELRRAGYAVAVCFGWEEAAKQIQSYIERVRAGNHGIDSATKGPA